MKRFPIVLAAVALVAAGCFAAASIASSGRLLDELTGTTATTATTTQTETGENGGGQPSGRRVVLCHRTGSKKKGNFKFHTITVDQHAVKAHTKHGDTVGACPSTTTKASTTTTTSSSSNDKGSQHGNGKSSEHGNGNGNGNGHGSDHGNNGHGGKP